LPEDIQLVLDAAEVYVRDRFAESLPRLLEIVEQDPTNKYATYMLGEVYLHSATHADVAKGAEMFERVLQLDPSFHFIYEHLCSALWYDGRRDEARAWLRRWEADEPEAVAYIGAVLDMREGRIEEAAATIEALDRPKSAGQYQAFRHLGDLLREDWGSLPPRPSSAPDLISPLQPDPRYELPEGPESQGRIADKLVYLGRLAEAMAIYADIELPVIEVSPDGLGGSNRGIGNELRVHIGEVLGLDGRPLIEQNIGWQPDAYRWRYDLARLAARGGDIETARAQLEHLEDLVTRGWSPVAPLYRDATRAELAMAEGDPARARELYRAVLDSDRIYGDGWVYQSVAATLWREGLARACEQDGDPAAAAEAWRQLVDSGLDRAVFPAIWVPALYRLGVLELQLGNVDEGRAQLQRFLGYWGEADVELEMVADAKARLAAD
jgi:tetratricopeptide (TPR) repeat protein